MHELAHRHDKELEYTLLACCFAHPECLDESWSALPDEVFYLQSCRETWVEINKQYREDGAFDFATVVAAFRLKGNYDFPADVLVPVVGIFGGDYHPTSAYACLYAKQLKKLYVAREKAKATSKYQQAIADGNSTGDAALELEAVISALDASVQDFDERSDEDLAELIGSGARYQTGMSAIDDLTGGLAKPGLNILAARPSVGKSACARAIIRHAAGRGEKVLLYSQDQSENQILELEIARHKHVSTDFVRKHMSFEEIVSAIKGVRENVWRGRVTLIDTPLKLDKLLTIIKTTLPTLVVIDYIQIIDTGQSDEYESITTVSKALKTLALQLRIPILALAQFNRQFTPGKPPTLAQLRGSGQLEQDADVVMALDRDTTVRSSEQQDASLYVLKNKVGATGKAALHWHGKYASFENAAPQHHERTRG